MPMPDPVPLPYRTREERTVASKRLARTAVHAAGMSQEALADELGVSRAYLRKCLSRDEEHAHSDLHVRDVLGLPPAAMRVIRDALNGELGEVSMAIPSGEAGPLDRSLLTRALRELNEVPAALSLALEDELLDDREKTLVLSEALEAMRVLGAIVERCGGVVSRRRSTWPGPTVGSLYVEAP